MDIATVVRFMDEFAPRQLAEDWDNVGLLVGDPSQSVNRVMTCLTYTLDVAQEAIEWGAELVVSHHPIPFRPLKRLTVNDPTQRVLWESIRAGISIYSPHTAFDSASRGINQQLAERLGLQSISPLRTVENQARKEAATTAEGEVVGAGRWGRLEQPTTGTELVASIGCLLGVEGIQIVGELSREYHAVGVACGAAGSFLDDAIRAGCDVFLTGETNFHTCLEARTRGALLVLPGHFATERFAVVQLADVLQQQFADLICRPSEMECDPVKWVETPNVDD